jgi:hypothetical protein
VVGRLRQCNFYNFFSFDFGAYKKIIGRAGANWLIEWGSSWSSWRVQGPEGRGTAVPPNTAPWGVASRNDMHNENNNAGDQALFVPVGGTFTAWGTIFILLTLFTIGTYLVRRCGAGSVDLQFEFSDSSDSGPESC